MQSSKKMFKVLTKMYLRTYNDKTRNQRFQKMEKKTPMSTTKKAKKEKHEEAVEKSSFTLT
jgi:hypothetical protein